MKRAWQAAGRLGRSLYARIALVYLAGLLLLALATAWIATSQFDQIGREMQQRMQLNLADDLAGVMSAPLRHGADSAAARAAAGRILRINPSLSLYVLNGAGQVVGDYAGRGCGANARVDPAPLRRLLGAHPMLPVFVTGPCGSQRNVFSVSRIRYGPGAQPGYLLAVLDAGPRISMAAMLRTSSITRTLLIAGLLALFVAGAAGLALFALLTRRFSRLTGVVQRFADGDYAQRIAPTRDDEIGRLGRAFNDMAATIEAQMAALHENARQRQALIANLSHDFRTPLTSLQGYAKALRVRGAADDDARDAYLAAIIANVERLTGLAGALSQLARADVFEEPLRIEPFSLAELMQDVAGKFRPQAEAAGVALSVDCAPDLPLVAADLSLIDRVLGNLVDNALQATPAGGRVAMTVVRVDGRLAVSVCDTGRGLGAEELPLVTQRFYRTAAGRAAGDGSGLGLAIAREICERHDTRLEIRSTPGAGTQIRFELALA